MGTELFRTILAMQVAVGGLRKALRISEERDLPPCHEGDGDHQKAPGIGLLHEKQGREHHGVVPIINAAGAAALILQEPGLEGTKEQNADHVTDGIKGTQQDHDAVIEDPHHVQGSEQAVKCDPKERHQHDRVVVLDLDLRFAGLDIILRKLLLATGAFKSRREKPEDHLYDKKCPNRDQYKGMALDQLLDLPAPQQSIDHVIYQKQNERKGPGHQSHVMVRADHGQFYLFLFATHSFSPDRMKSLAHALLPFYTYGHEMQQEKGAGSLQCGKHPDESVSDPSVPLVAIVLKIYAIRNAAIQRLEELNALEELWNKSKIVINVCMCKYLTGKLAQAHAGDLFLLSDLLSHLFAICTAV